MKRTRNGLSYMGSKYKLFPWLFEKLPNNIETMKVLDAFGGGGSVSFSLSENYPNIDITYNEFNNDVYRIFNYINKNHKDKIMSDYNSIDPFLIGKNSTYFDNRGKNYKPQNMKKMREIYQKIKIKEKHKDYELYYLLQCSFGKVIKTNAGDRAITKRVLGKHKNYENIKTTNKDFRDVNFNNYDFIYFDPPYVDTAKYKNDFGKEDELDLLRKIDVFNKNGGKFMMSNYPSANLIEWAAKNKYKVLYKNDFKSLGGTVTKSIEILVMNY